MGLQLYLEDFLCRLRRTKDHVLNPEKHDVLFQKFVLLEKILFVSTLLYLSLSFDHSKMCLNENYSRVSVSKHMYDTLHIYSDMKQDAYSLWLVNFTLEYAIRGVQVKKNVLKLIYIRF
jgi:hypothetical protein